MKRKGALTVVGLGYRAAAQVTPEVLSAIGQSDKLYHLVYDPLTTAWIRAVHPNSTSLADSWKPGASVAECCDAMVRQIMASVRAGTDVCVAFSGHPTICVYPTRESLRLAKREGFKTRIFPGLSAIDCLFADIGVDPGLGCQIWETKTLLVRKPKLNPKTNIVLLQLQMIGRTADDGAETNREGLEMLRSFLMRVYPRHHRAAIYEAATFPVAGPVIQWIPLGHLPRAVINALSTLLIPGI